MKKAENNNVVDRHACPLQMIILVIALMLILPSCSGGAGGGTSSASVTGGAGSSQGAGGNGNLYMRIAWPDAPRDNAPRGNAPRGSASNEGGKYIPSTAAKITIDISGTGITSTEHYEYARPESGQTTVNLTLPVGAKIAEIRATDSGGNTLSYSRSSFSVAAGQTASISVNLGVGISDTGFTPSNISIPKGTTLQFVNNGSISHTVTDLSGAFNSGAILAGASWSNTFNTAGVFYYRDTYNTSLTGIITVTDSTSPPNPPSNLAAVAVASSRVNLTWTDNSTDETGFKIERKTGAGGAYSQIATVGAGVISYSNTALAASTVYYYRIRAYSAYGNSDYSNEANASTSARYVYVANNNSHNISVINTATNTVTATINVWSGLVGSPSGIAVTSDGNFTYSTRNNAVVKINNATNAIINTIDLGASSAHGLTITPDGNFIYVTMRESDSVKVINTTTNTVVATIAVGDNPYGVAVTYDGMRAYVTNQGANTISAIDTATNTVTATFNPGVGNPQGITMIVVPNPDPSKPSNSVAYIANNNPGGIRVVDVGLNESLVWLWVPNNPASVAASPDNLLVYAGIEGGENRVDVISTATNSVTASVAVGTGPRALVVTPDGAYVYAANYGTDNVSVINTATNTVIATIAVGTNPYGIAVTP